MRLAGAQPPQRVVESLVSDVAGCAGGHGVHRTTSRSASTIASTSAGIVYCAGTIAVWMPYCAAASAVTGPIDATTVGAQQIGGRLGAEQLDEIAHRRRARERDDVDRALEQHAVDVGLAFALGLDRDRAVGDDFGHVRAALAQLLGDHLAPDVGARQQHALALQSAGRRRIACTTASARDSAGSRSTFRPSRASRSAVAGPTAQSFTPLSARTSAARRAGGA